MKVAVIGMGFVGLTLALKLSSRGFNVLGIDTDQEKLDTLADKKPFFLEPNLHSFLEDALNSNRLRLMHPHALFEVEKCAAVFITVGTPVVSGESDFSHIDATVPTIVKLLDSETIVALRSTVAVGTSRALDQKIRERLGSEATYGGICSTPERTIEGAALKELGTIPQLLGADDPNTRERARKIFEKSGVEVVDLPDTASAELAKLVSNCYRDFHFSLGNLFHYIANGLNLDSRQIIDAVNYKYERAKVPQPGPVAGPCLEKDAYILAASLPPELGDEKALVLGLRSNNEMMAAHIVNRVNKRLGFQKSRIAICGVAFKGQPATDDTRGSMALPIIVQLSESHEILLHDYEVKGPIMAGRTAYEVTETLPLDCDLYLYLNNHENYKTVEKVNYIDVWE